MPAFYNDDLNEMYDNIKNKQLTFPDYVSNEAKDLIKVIDNIILILILF